MTADRAREESRGQQAEDSIQSSVSGLSLDAAATVRSGEDGRRRGWFWHWNSIVTQYSPLLGLKGVGLLNSYTVWTDRREESPHRGYAFPSQQSEADFYGEDRAELITINKILVALDLIEIRKEMVLRTDPQGRRWRVPHNFYRVKDHDDGFALSGRDVLRVAELAERDKAVYRHVRRVFSPRFAPIDGDNVWHRILPELRRTEVWQGLAARAAAEEGRASARTRAGHAARRAAGGPGPDAGPEDAAREPFFVPSGGDAAAPVPTPNDTNRVDTQGGQETSVDRINNGSAVDVAAANRGWDRPETTSVAPSNAGEATAVDPTNTTYYDSDVTTTTTAGASTNASPPAAPALLREGSAAAPASGTPGGGASGAEGVDDAASAVAGSAAASVTVGTGVPRAASSPLGDPPGDAPGEAAAIRAFEAANARPATPAERTLLRGLAERFAPAAEAVARLDPAAPASGWGWLAAAAYEAVEAGSAFVAPRRLREILARWERDGFPQREDGGPLPSARPSSGGAAGSGARRARANTAAGAAPAPPLGEGPDLDLPHGHGARRTWAFAVGLLAEAVEPAALAALVAGTAIVGYRDGEVTIAVPDAARAERLATTHRDLVARKLSEAMRRPVRLAVLTTDGGGRGAGGGEDGAAAATTGWIDRGSTAEQASPSVGARDRVPLGRRNPNSGGRADADAEADRPETAVPIDFPVAECGLPSGQVWAAVLAEVAAGGEVSPANFDAWLRPTVLAGRGGDGGAGSALVVAVPHALARRRVAARFLPALRSAVAAVVGVALPVEVVPGDDAAGWAAGNASDGDAPRSHDVGA